MHCKFFLLRNFSVPPIIRREIEKSISYFWGGWGENDRMEGKEKKKQVFISIDCVEQYFGNCSNDILFCTLFRKFL